MTDNFILYPETLAYLSKINRFLAKHPNLKSLEKRAIEKNKPIIQREGAIFLMMLLAIKRPKHVLEIGTNIGFSASCMGIMLEGIGAIDTIEFQEENVVQAKKNVPKNVTVYHSEALDFLKTLKKEKVYDFVFIDANKKDNLTYIELITPHLKAGSIICVDNVLWKGRTASRSLVNERSMTSTIEIRKFNRSMSKNLLFYTQILPIGDGILMAVKK